MNCVSYFVFTYLRILNILLLFDDKNKFNIRFGNIFKIRLKSRSMGNKIFKSICKASYAHMLLTGQNRHLSTDSGADLVLQGSVYQCRQRYYMGTTHPMLSLGNVPCDHTCCGQHSTCVRPIR